MARPLGVFLAITLLATACGEEKASPPTREKRELAQLRTDIRRIERAAAPITHQTLMGTPALMRATGTFLDHLDRSTLAPYTKSRLINRAAAAAAAACEQCFQQ